ncbi:MAG: hypothetical protein HY979_00500, partial [Candidatus Magasanikbacteria bacterium]|nr:hypothetical protein [Candidatus Magasanikbacteria bacterium]
MSDRLTFDNFIGSLPPEVQAALFDNQGKVSELGHRLAAAAGSVFTRRLEYQPGIIVALVQKGGPWGYLNPNITDANYPVKGEGAVDVRCRILRGEDLKRPDGYVYNVDVDAAFVREGMRRPNPAEGLLVPAQDSQIGRGGHPLVMLLAGSQVAFYVDEDVGQRKLHQFSDDG